MNRRKFTLATKTAFESKTKLTSKMACVNGPLDILSDRVSKIVGSAQCFKLLVIRCFCVSEGQPHCQGEARVE